MSGWGHHREPEVLDDAFGQLLERVRELEAERARLRDGLAAMAEDVSDEAFHPNAPGDGRPLIRTSSVYQLIADLLTDDEGPAHD